MKKFAAVVCMLAAGVGCTHQASKITEDDPRWDCHTMGNRVCGDQVTKFNQEMKDAGYKVIYPQVAGVCDSLRKDHSLFEAAGIVSDLTEYTNPEEIGFIVGVTVKNFCPEMAGVEG